MLLTPILFGVSFDLLFLRSTWFVLTRVFDSRVCAVTYISYLMSDISTCWHAHYIRGLSAKWRARHETLSFILCSMLLPTSISPTCQVQVVSCGVTEVSRSDSGAVEPIALTWQKLLLYLIYCMCSDMILSAQLLFPWESRLGAMLLVLHIQTESCQLRIWATFNPDKSDKSTFNWKPMPPAMTTSRESWMMASVGKICYCAIYRLLLHKHYYFLIEKTRQLGSTQQPVVLMGGICGAKIIIHLNKTFE